jgi:thiol-disulfide isomerase/thioredoxin
MDAFLIALRLALAAIFLTAAAAKLMDAAGARKALASFGVPAGFAERGWLLLPVTEGAVAVLLLPDPTAWWGATAGTLLLAIFTAAIVVNLVRGRAPECHCFGQLSTAPISWLDVARNGVFLAVGAVVAVQGPGNTGPSAVAWLGDLSGVEAGLLAVSLVALAGVAVEGWFLLELLAQQGRLLLRLDEMTAAAGGSTPAAQPSPTLAAGLPVGSSAPDFQAIDLERGEVGLVAFTGNPVPTLFIFSNPHCGPCEAMMPRVAAWQAQHAARLRIAVLTEGERAENRKKRDQFGLRDVFLQHGREIAEMYQVNGTPGAVLVASDGRIASPAAMGEDAIANLIAATTGATEPAGAAVETIPATLPDARPVAASNPCPLCQPTAGGFPAYNVARAERDPRLAFLASGNPQEQPALGLRSTIVLSSGFSGQRPPPGDAD